MGRAFKILRDQPISLTISDETSKKKRAEAWVRKSIRSGSASASSAPGIRSWYEEKNYAKWLHETSLREYVKKKLGQAGISKVEMSAPPAR